MRGGFGRIFEACVDLLICETCLLCGSEDVLAFPGRLCAACVGGLALVEPQRSCLLCAAVLPASVRRRERCLLCRPRRPPYRSLSVMGAYESTLALLLRRLKYQPLLAAAIPVSELLATLAVSLRETGELRGIDLILPVPLHRERLARRGFNQAAEIARLLPARLGAEMPVHWAKRRSDARQVGRSRTARRRLGQDVFRIDPRVIGRRVLVVDDVVTTGATLRAFSRAVLGAGAMDVQALAAARTP